MENHSGHYDLMKRSAPESGEQSSDTLTARNISQTPEVVATVEPIYGHWIEGSNIEYGHGICSV